MTYKLFIDDERFPPDVSYNEWVVTQSSNDAIWAVESYGLPQYISFDHDLGGEDTSIVFINWLINHMLDNKLSFPKDFEYYVHSQNPVGKKNIENLMDNFIKFTKEQ